MRALAAAFKVLPGEGRLVLLLVAQSFCIGLARMWTQTASSTLFLSVFDVQRLPYVYITVSLVVPLMGFVYTRLETRLSLLHLTFANLGTLLLVLAVLSLSLALPGARWPAFGLAVWYEAIWAMTSLALWGVAGRLLNVRQGKRLFGLVSAGDVVAATIGGFLTPLLVGLFGLPILFAGAAAGLAGALALAAYTMGAYGGTAFDESDEDTGTRRDDTSSVQRRYVALMVTLIVTSHASFYFIDNIFYNQVEARFPSEEQLASFIGLFFAIVNLTMLASNLFLVSRVISRFGVRIGLLVLPLLTAVTTAVAVVSGLFAVIPAVVFGVAVANNFLDWVFRETIYKSSLLMLYQPLSPSRRLRVQTVSESIAQPAAMGLTGVALVGLGVAGFGVMQFNAVLLGMLVICVVLALPLGRRYGDMLLHALERRTLGGGRGMHAPLGKHSLAPEVLNPADATGVAILRQALESPYPGAVVYALDLLEQMEHPALEEGLLRSLEHPAPELRREVLRRLELRRLGSALDAVRRRLTIESEPAVLGDTLRTLAVLDHDGAMDHIMPFLDHPDSRVCEGALAGLLRSGALHHVLIGGERLVRLLDSPAPNARAQAARVLGDVAVAQYDQPVLRLLHDPDGNVRRAALAAAGKLQSARLWPEVIALLGAPDLHAEAAAALSAGGPAAAPELIRALRQPDLPLEVIRRLVRIAGRLEYDGVIPVLRDYLGARQAELRYDALVALSRQGWRAANDDRGWVEQRLAAEVHEAALLLAALVDLGEDDADALLSAALHEAVMDCRERVLLLLACLYDKQVVARVRDTLVHSSAEKRAYALEALDMLIDREQKDAVLPLMEELTPAERLDRLQAVAAPGRRSRDEHLVEIITDADERHSAWLRSSALYALALDPTDDAAALLERASSSSNPLVTASAHWTAARLGYRLAGSAGEEQGRATAMLSVIEKVLILKTVGIFAAVPDATLAEVAGLLEEVDLGPDEQLFAKGEPGRSMYIIVAGKVRVHDGERLLNYLDERDIVGEMAVLGAAVRTASVTAVESTRLLRLDQDPLYELMADNIAVVRRIMQVLIERLQARVADVGDLHARLEALDMARA